MAITRLADVIQPEVFTPYVIQRTMELSAFYQSGIIANDAQMNMLASGPHTLANMPYFEDLTGSSQNMTDTGLITPMGIGTNMDIATKIARTNAWGANGLSALLSGADPMGAIADRVAAWWMRDMQRTLLAELSGVFASAGMANKVHDITGEAGDAALLSASTFVDANQVMGDAKGNITALAVHSAVEAYLAKLQLIEYEETKDKATRIPTFMGKRVIVDDGIPFNSATKEATIYLFGAGALAMGNGNHPRIIQTEIDRDKMASSGEDYLINRKVYILHPRGVKWTASSVADVFPTDAELATAANWERVYEEKAVRLVCFKCKVA